MSGVLLYQLHCREQRGCSQYIQTSGRNNCKTEFGSSTQKIDRLLSGAFNGWWQVLLVSIDLLIILVSRGYHNYINSGAWIS